MNTRKISIVVPVLNEEANVAELVRRFDVALKAAEIEYEIIFVDDHSTDKTRDCIEGLSKKYPLSLYIKKGERGKARSLLQGFSYARYPYVAMIDADLQYPPEEVAAMFEKLHQGRDIMVAKRINHETSLSRKVIGRVFTFLFSKVLHDLHCDVQSGLKVFKRRILDEVKIDPSPWTFDLEFLLKARNYGYVIGNHDIVFSERKKRGGESKVVLWKAIGEIGINAIKLKLKGRQPLLLHPESAGNMLGAGMAHARQRFVTHTTLHHHFSAITTFSFWQRAGSYLFAILLAIGLAVNPLNAIIALVAVLSFVYFIDVFFNLFLVLRSLKKPPEIKSSLEELRSLDETNLPTYSILCPMYREAHMLPGFIEAISNLEWPKIKLDVLLLLEENDPETVAAARAMNLPEFVRIIVVPHSMPKTKPKACNYGLSYARGEYVVIYDAEDIPDPLQLKKAYLGFIKSPEKVRCLQAKLNYFNPHHNFLTRLFTAEYSLWFDISLPGLQSVNTSIPLGGTSNHFRTKDLLELEGWDPFNVTEDCDLGVRIFKRGYRTAIIDSVTLEEANSQVGNWMRQRSRWIKGYMQTYLVHMRNPIKFFRENGIHAFLFQMVVGGKLAFIFINPFLWLATIAYFTLNQYVGATIESLYPNVVFYMAVISLVFGNFLAMYYYMLGCAKRGHWPVIKYVFFVPVYWFMVSVAGFVALYQLFVKPHYWEKTNHGLHLKKRKSFISLVDGVFRGFRKQEQIFPVRAVATVDAKPAKADIKVEKAASIFASKKFFKKWRKMLFSPEGIFLQALLFSNFLNFLFNAFLGRYLDLSQFALVAFVNTMWYMTLIFLGAFSTSINHETAYGIGKQNERPLHLNWMTFALRHSLSAMLAFLALWVVITPWLAQYFKVDLLVLYLFTPAFVFGIILTASRGYIQGTSRFILAGVLVLVESLLKLVLAVLFVKSGQSDFAYLSIPLSVAFAGCIVLFVMRKEFTWRVSLRELRKDFSFPTRFYFAALVGSFGTLVFLNLDILLVKHYLDSQSAGEYALLALVGKMIFFFGTLPASLMITLVSRSSGEKSDTETVFWNIYSLTLASVAGSIAGLLLFGNHIIPWLFGNKALVILPYLNVYIFGFGFFTLASVIASYHLARKQFLFSTIAPFSALIMGVSIILNHNTVQGIVFDVAFSGIFAWVLLQAMHLAEPHFAFIRRGLRDLWGIFVNGLPKAQPSVSTGKRILIFNWRDTTHAYAGGAEVYVHQIAKIWVKQGNHVTIFCGNDGKQARYENIDSIDIVRRGGFYLVYLWAFLYYMFRFRGKYDIIIDCQNGVPFFTPLYAKEPVYCLMHHVHQEVFFRHLAKPLAIFASFLEKDLMPLVYRKIKFITVSESSKNEMLKIGLGEAGIQVVHNGVHLDEFIAGERDIRPTVLYLGRLKAYKSVDILLRAFCQVLEKQPDAQLIIAGTGDAEKYLRDLALSLGLTDQQINFKGRVAEKEKINLLQKAWALVNPSMMEGWGIVVIEANACGTPVIASDVPGLRDSVRASESGYLVPYGDVSGFAREILNIFQNNQLREKMGKNARAWAENFAWEKSSEKFLEILES
ncbi:MAG: glycosyltransferase [Patescibacteria group bacterium]